MNKILRKTDTRTLRLGARIVGALWTSLLLLLGGLALTQEVKELGLKTFVARVPEAFVNWRDSPEALFYVYMAGYLITWWNAGLGGSVLLLLGLVPAIVSGDPVTSVMFCLPVAIVGLLHLVYWLRLWRERTSDSLGSSPTTDST